MTIANKLLRGIERERDREHAYEQMCANRRDTDAARYYRARIELARGRVLDAERDLRALRTSPQPRLRADSASSLALIAYESGDFDAVNRHLMSALAAGLEGDGRADALLLSSYSNLKLGRAEPCREYARLYACAAPRALSPGRARMLREIASAMNR